MQESIERGGSHDGVAGEDVAPFGEGFVGGDDSGGLFLVATADDLEVQRGLLVVESKVNGRKWIKGSRALTMVKDVQRTKAVSIQMQREVPSRSTPQLNPMQNPAVRNADR